MYDNARWAKPGTRINGGGSNGNSLETHHGQVVDLSGFHECFVPHRRQFTSFLRIPWNALLFDGFTSRLDGRHWRQLNLCRKSTWRFKKNLSSSLTTTAMTKTAHCFARLLHGGLILSTSVSSLGFWLSLMAPYSKASLFLVLVTPGAGVIQQHLEFCFRRAFQLMMKHNPNISLYLYFSIIFWVVEWPTLFKKIAQFLNYCSVKMWKGPGFTTIRMFHVKWQISINTTPLPRHISDIKNSSRKYMHVIFRIQNGSVLNTNLDHNIGFFHGI